MRFPVAAILSAFIALPAMAQVYQCKDSAGRLTFADRPCSGATSGGLVQRQKSDAEIYRERMEAAEANERKYQRQVNEMQQRQLETQQRMLDQQARRAAAVPEQPGTSYQCKQARKDLEFVSSIRTISQDEKRNRTNAAIANVNASCGTNTPLMQEPPKVIVRPAPVDDGPIHRTLQNCNGAYCYDTGGNSYFRNGPFLTDRDGRSCQQQGGMLRCN